MLHEKTMLYSTQVTVAADRPAQHSASDPPCCTQMLIVSVINWRQKPSTVYHSDRPSTLTEPEMTAVPKIWLVPT